MSNEQLEKLRAEERELANQYEERSAEAGKAFQRVTELEQQLMVLDGDQKHDASLLHACTENSSLEEIAAIQARIAARPVLMERLRDAIAIAKARFTEKERHMVQLNRPLGELRDRIKTIVEVERRAKEEKLRLEIRRRVERELQEELAKEEAQAQAQTQTRPSQKAQKA